MKLSLPSIVHITFSLPFKFNRAFSTMNVSLLILVAVFLTTVCGYRDKQGDLNLKLSIMASVDILFVFVFRYYDFIMSVFCLFKVMQF